MKRALIGACCVACFVLSGAAESRGRPDDVRPAKEGVCADLKGGTPSLYGLCVAFHLGMGCEPNFSADDPFANCKPGSQKVLAQYEKKMRTGDPVMPGLQGACPCWSSVELLLLQRPTPGDATSCDLNKSSFGFTNLDQWTMMASSGGENLFTTLHTMEENLALGANGSRCVLNDQATGILRHFSITHEEFLACEPDVAWSAADRGIDCVNHAETEDSLPVIGIQTLGSP